MLTRLLRTYLRRYRAVLAGVVGLQFVQTVAALYLPRLFANIIDKGVAKGNNRYVWTTGSVMLVITLVQVVFAIGAVYFGSRSAMGFGRADARVDDLHPAGGRANHCGRRHHHGVTG